MTNEEAIARIKDHMIIHKINEPRAIYISEALDMAIEALEVEPRWIPIEQDCPKMGRNVLISHNGVVSIDWLIQSEGVGYFFVSGVAVQDIDAWMPLPEPYREVEK